MPLVVSSCDEIKTLENSIENLWKLELIGVNTAKCSEDNEKALRQFENSIILKDGRVHVTWLSKIGIENLPENFGLALSRLQGLLKRLSKEKPLLEKYDCYFKDLLQRGIISKTNYGPQSTEKQSHYISHQAIQDLTRISSKLRIVFDASARTTLMKKSLNDYLLKGDDYLPNICSLLLRFRLHKIAIIADLEKAFLMVAIHEDQRGLGKFLWINDISRPETKNNLICYLFNRCAFGLKCSPFILHKSIEFLLSLAKTKEEKEIAQLLKYNMYVDNAIIGCETLEQAKRIYYISKVLFRTGSMNL